MGTWELVIIFLAVLVLFGGKKIPEVARGLGKGLREFKKITGDIQREIELSSLDDNNKSPSKPPTLSETESVSPDKLPTSTETDSATPLTSSEPPSPKKPENNPDDAARNS
jgi:sec-independent protein translocase protein TatA